MLTLLEQWGLEKLRAQDQREIKRLHKELCNKAEALAEAAALLLVTKKMQALWVEVEEDWPPRRISGGHWRFSMARWLPVPRRCVWQSG